jgi:hypothetical protein
MSVSTCGMYRFIDVSRLIKMSEILERHSTFAHAAEYSKIFFRGSRYCVAVFTVRLPNR